MLGKSGETIDLGHAGIAVVEMVQRLRQATGTAKGNGLCVPFNQHATFLEHNLQQILGTQTLSSSPI